MPRDTFYNLMQRLTWPSEWPSHMAFMAYADWMHTVDKAWLRSKYQQLQTKLILDRDNADSLVESQPHHIKIARTSF